MFAADDETPSRAKYFKFYAEATHNLPQSLEANAHEYF